MKAQYISFTNIPTMRLLFILVQIFYLNMLHVMAVANLANLSLSSSEEKHITHINFSKNIKHVLLSSLHPFSQRMYMIYMHLKWFCRCQKLFLKEYITIVSEQLVSQQEYQFAWLIFETITNILYCRLQLLSISARL